MTGLGTGTHLGPRVSDLLDGRLSGADEVTARNHVGACRSCAAAVHREQQVRAMLRAARADQPCPPGNLMAGLMALAASGSSAPSTPQGASAVVLAPSTGLRRGGSVLLGAAVLGTVSLASAGLLGSAVLPAPGTAAVRWGDAATASLAGSLPTVQEAGSSVVRTGVGAVVVTGVGQDPGRSAGTP